MKDSGCVCIKLWSSVAWIHNNPMCIEILHIRMYQIFVISLDLIWAFEFYESHTSVRITEHCSEGSYAYTPLSYGVIQYLLSGRCDRQTAINLCHKFYCKRLGITESGTQDGHAWVGLWVIMIIKWYLCLRLISHKLHRLQLKKMIYDCIRKCWWLQRS